MESWEKEVFAPLNNDFILLQKKSQDLLRQQEEIGDRLKEVLEVAADVDMARPR
jgi:hypothetical protein